MPALSASARERAKDYSLRFTTVLAQQQLLDNTTDEEEAGNTLFEAKRELATDAVLDSTLSEPTCRVWRATSTPSAKMTPVRFRSYAYDPQTIARRNECLRVTPATNDKHGADRFGLRAAC